MGSSWTRNKLQVSRVQKVCSLRIRAFRAVDDVEMSERYAQEHENVLLNHGIKKLSSASRDWVKNPNVYVLLITSPSGHRLYGGARIHKHSSDIPLPVQRAVAPHDESIHQIVEEFSKEGCVELCALWNKIEIAGLGLGSRVLLKAAISLADTIKFRHLLALSSPVTRKWIKEFGFSNITEIGKDGKIPYPDDRFVATVAHYIHPDCFENILDDFRTEIDELRMNPMKKGKTSGVKGSVTVHFDLLK